MDIKNTIYTEDYRVILAKLKDARIQKGLTQNEVAHRLGVGQSFISKIESGQYRLDIIQLQVLGKLYGKGLSFFLDDK